MLSLKEIREKLAESNTIKSQVNYPFWNIPDGMTSTVRFLPDGDPENTFFWVEQQVVKLPFPGSDKYPTKETVVTVPCMRMYNKFCPIQNEIKNWWNDPALESQARTYYRKCNYIFQGLVIKDQVGEKNTPDSPIRNFVLGPTLFKIIKSSLLDDDFENIPSDFKKGTNFNICKTRNGNFNDYSTSKWNRKESEITPPCEALPHLKDLLPEEPTSEELHVIYEMFEASCSGELYNGEKWSKFFKPYNY